jgi:hypothetical protein
MTWKVADDFGVGGIGFGKKMPLPTSGEGLFCRTVRSISDDLDKWNTL